MDRYSGAKHDDTISVEIFFDLFGKLIDLLVLFLDRTGKEHRGFPVGEPFSFFGLFDNGIDQFNVFFVLVRIGESFQDFFMVDKIIAHFEFTSYIVCIPPFPYVNFK